MDEREDIYRDLQNRQLEGEVPATRDSARKVLSILFNLYRPESVLDVGCGLGAWLASAREMGVAEIRGIEGSWIDRSKLVVEPESIDWIDLEGGFSLGRKFDLVLCTEVAEHLSPEAAERFVRCLTQHGDVVLFSAAIPFQGGHHHVNEQFADYWAKLFGVQGFAVLDPIRPRIWNDEKVLWWLRQNLLVFANDPALSANEKLAAERAQDRILSIVHPMLYNSRMTRALKATELLNFISTGGTFDVAVQPNGEVSVRRRT